MNMSQCGETIEDSQGWEASHKMTKMKTAEDVRCELDALFPEDMGHVKKNRHTAYN